MKKAKGVPEGERTIVLRQMKVRTALKGDFSWINNKKTDEDDEEEEGLAKDVPVKASYSNGVSSAPSASSSTSESSTSQKPSPSGYIIRGVFTKTNDTTHASPASTSSYGYGESVRSSNTSTPQYSPLNKRSAEHYKKIAPHNVRSKAASPAPEEPPSSTEEHTKRTEAANSVLKSSASKERSYVLSAVNKYSSPEKLSKDPSFSFVAKRVEISDEEPEEDCDTSPRITPKINLNQKPTATPRKLSSSTETITQTMITKKESVSETPKPSTEPETKSSQDTKSLWDQWDLPAATETATTTVTEKRSQGTKSAWDKWDVPAATATTITTVTEKSSQDTKSLRDQWYLPAATETTTTTVTKKSSQDTKSAWDKWDKPAATETAITTVKVKSSDDTKSAWDKWNVPAAIEITTTTVTEKSPSIQTQTTVTKKETVFETEPVAESAFKIAKETKQDPSTASDLISFGMEENTSVTSIHTTKYQTEDPVHKTFDSSDLTNITTATTTHWSETPDPEYKKLVMVKGYVNSTGFNPSEYSSINKYDDITYSHSNYSYSSPSAMYRSSGTSSCTYCGEMVGDDARITIEHLNIYSHPSCFKCGVCSKPMGELLESMYIHRGQVHCDSCYDKVF
ncbi:zinc finger protein 185-like isoform X2 [Polyodon spathula]|uniref:zinc finger protein 185-like isoform X2 n=1 Tax=Polyodon spathula TaxID=7913 RepID=UPI001B7DA407|nr:zinc finger protein 185-like isoform X2 [Polyodon spathula]